MLGMDRLPTGIIPVTSVITAVSYNTRERVVVRFEGSNLTHEMPLAELPEWITERGNPGNRKKVEMAEVQLPAELLRRGAFFVDTPGLGSAIAENTETTHRFLAQIDALVLVTSFEFALSQEEISFLRRARALRRKVFVVVNKLDLCKPGQREDVLHFIRTRIAEDIDAQELPLFAVSSSDALAGKLEGNVGKLERSGLPSFERALVNYLVADRSRDFIAAMCDRFESVIATREITALRDLEPRLDGIRMKVLDQARRDRDPHRVHLGEERLRAAGQPLKITLCFVCKRMADATFEFLRLYQYDLSHSRERQLFHASRSGFCTLHTREYARLASPQGIASGYPNTLLLAAENLRKLMNDGRLREDWRDRFGGFLPGRQKCRACQVVAEAEEKILVEFVHEYGGVQKIDDRDLPCVCLSHLYGILQIAPGTELANRMVVQSADVLERTAENMERFALRHGGLHMELVTDEELHSSERGLNLIVGQPNVHPSRTPPA